MRNEKVRKLVLLALLSALGVVLMAIVEIPYPPAPFLKIEVSDVVILIVFALFGFKESLLVAIVKTVGDLMFSGAVGPYAIGQITALTASLGYVALLKITQIIKNKYVRYTSVVIGITLFMTLANYLIITPIFLGENSFLDMAFGSLVPDKSYLVGVLITYIPFNMIKGVLVVLVFALSINRIKTIAIKEDK